jgi:hypothetical protein
MTALAGLGKLGEARQFPRRDVEPGDIAALTISPHYAAYWADLLPVLGPRPDLAAAVEAALAKARRTAAWFDETGWKGKLRALDRRLLSGRLLAARRVLKGTR